MKGAEPEQMVLPTGQGETWVEKNSTEREQNTAPPVFAKSVPAREATERPNLETFVTAAENLPKAKEDKGKNA
jgi:hypothetical protein